MRVRLTPAGTLALNAALTVALILLLAFCVASCAGMWGAVKASSGPAVGGASGAGIGLLFGPIGVVIGAFLGALIGHALTFNAALIAGELKGAPPIDPGIPIPNSPFVVPPWMIPSATPWWLTWRGGLVLGILWILWLKRLYVWEVLKDFARRGLKAGLASTGKLAVNLTVGGNKFRRPIKG